TARMCPTSGYIGRVAVLAKHRGRGVGTMLVQRLHMEAEVLGLTETYLGAQLTAEEFYCKLGYVRSNQDIFMDGGLEHVRMHRTITPMTSLLSGNLFW
ncbi:hypothetical protein KIPB_007238, partial [Kipferlia bialata]